MGVLATFAYDNLGRRTSLARGNGTSTSYSYDAVSRLSQLTDNPAGTTYDQTLGFSYNPASQIASNTRSNDLFAWGGHGSGSTSSTANGLNQITAHGGTGTSHDARGNMTADGLGKTFGYSSENLLTSGSGGVTAAYDPAMRLYQTAGAATTRFAYDGAALIAEYNGSNSLQRRFVHGPGVDEALVWYEGSGTTDRRFLHADERGSVTAVSNGSGSVTNVNTYDEYGKPGSGNVGRFQYTGQKWIAELGLYDYKARMYHPGLPRFLQTDPIGYADGMNLYAYVKGDPINFVDPSGMFGKCYNVWTVWVYKDTKEPTGQVDWNDRFCIPYFMSDGLNSDLLVYAGPTGTGGRGKVSKKEDLHYKVEDFAFCSADNLFAQFSKPGHSAPGAPAARPGTTFGIILTGGNPITQVVDSRARTITNITQEGHRYHSGTVVIKITPTWYGGSKVSIEGRGSTARFWENSILGKAAFTALAARATVGCTLGVN